MDSVTALTVCSDLGSGRPFILLEEHGANNPELEVLSAALASRTRVLRILVPRITDGNWEELTRQLAAALTGAGVRQGSFVTFGACCAIVQALALRDLKSVRTIVFVNASTRAHATRLTRLIDKLEHALPLGLPLRLENRGFDAKPFLQRIRCPVLVVTTASATPYQRGEAEVLEAGLPTAWRIERGADEPVESFADLIVDFQEVPAKCPQKRVSE